MCPIRLKAAAAAAAAEEEEEEMEEEEDWEEEFLPACSTLAVRSCCWRWGNGSTVGDRHCSACTCSAVLYGGWDRSRIGHKSKDKGQPRSTRSVSSAFLPTGAWNIGFSDCVIVSLPTKRIAYGSLSTSLYIESYRSPESNLAGCRQVPQYTN